MRAIELGSTVRRAHLPNLLAKKLFSIVSWPILREASRSRAPTPSRRPARPRIKRPRRMVQQLIFPRVDLVRMNLMALRQVCYVAAPHASAADISLFPGEWRRNSQSPFLTSTFHDVPYDDADLALYYGFDLSGRSRS